MEAAGGQILFWNGVRVMGVLAVSRAIGDHCLRPFVIAEPEVRAWHVWHRVVQLASASTCTSAHCMLVCGACVRTGGAGAHIRCVYEPAVADVLMCRSKGRSGSSPATVTGKGKQCPTEA